MAQLQLERPLGIGGVFAHTFIVYWRRFGAMAMVTLSFLVIPFVLILMGDCGVDPFTEDEVCGNFLGSIGLISFGVSGLVAGIAIILEVAGAYVGLPADWASVARAGLRKVVPILAVGILLGFLWFVLWFVPILILLLLGASVGFGIFIGAILMIFLQVTFHCLGGVLMIEGLGPMASLGRSWRLVSGERLRLFGVLLVIFVFIIAISIGVDILLSALGDAAADFLFYPVQTAFAVVFIPLFSSLTTVLYLDLRVRKEGLDEGTLAAELSM